MKKLPFLILFLTLAFTINAQETLNDSEPNQNALGLILSVSGFNGFRLGGGVLYAQIINSNHHSFGWDTGLLFEYNFKNHAKYTRAYGHITGGAAPALVGASMVIAWDNNGAAFGLAPEAGIGISSYFSLFFRYNFYFGAKRFNSYEIVVHGNLCLRK